jgi:thymidylate synthase (FAD)
VKVTLLAYTQGTKKETPEQLALSIAQVPYNTDSKTALRSALDQGHLSILEHISFTFEIEGLSRVAQQQLTRHRLASYTIESQRHVHETEFVMPESLANAGQGIQEMIRKHLEEAEMLVDDLSGTGFPEEDVRFLMPQGTSSGTIIATMNLRELRHFFKLRLATDAQWEIRECANEMFQLVYASCPTLFGGKDE